MAQIYGNPGKEEGDRKVYNALQALPAECIIYAQPKLVYKSEDCYPDYVIVNKSWGVIVLEVKDWVQIQSIDRHGLEVFRTQTRRWEYESCPLNQAKNAAQILNNMLTEDKDLRNHAGRLDFSYAYGVVFPKLFGVAINNCNHQWGVGYVLGLLDLSPDKITEKIQNIPAKSRVLMTDSQMRAVCAVIDGKNKVVNKETGEFKGVLDTTQESIAKEELIPQEVVPEIQIKSQNPLLAELFPTPDSRKRHLESEVPAEVMDLKSDMHVRLVRGFAGTGKTDVLVLRAQYLSEQYLEKHILVTTFNDPLYQNRLLPELKHLRKHIDVCKFDSLCSAIYKKRHGQWREPQKVRGLIAHMTERIPEIEEWGIDFLTDEFTWIKEAGRTKREDYINKPREGRGGEGGKTLSREQKQELFNLFEKYRDELRELAAFDWSDLHDKTLKYIEEGIKPDKNYDVILIDEAQHFAPAWMKIITHFLKPGGLLFLCDDPSQNVYRFFSWRQKGVDVVGKTRWLRVLYRNTRQIFEASFSLIADDAMAKRLLGEDKAYAIPDLESPTLRNGEKPSVRQFENIHSEEQFILKELIRLVESGVRQEEICILHNQKHVLDAYQKLLKDTKVNVKNAISQTGMEYTIVVIPQVQKIFDRTVGKSWEEDQSHQRLAVFMMMTRARSYLYMTYQQKWPKVLDGMRQYVEWVEVEG